MLEQVRDDLLECPLSVAELPGLEITASAPTSGVATSRSIAALVAQRSFPDGTGIVRASCGCHAGGPVYRGA
jgi:hypothetical protein